MTTIRPPRFALLSLAVLLAACVPVTVNINFPQEKLEGAAGKIEDMVRSPENPKPEPQPKKGPQGSISDRALVALGPREAVAQSRNVDVDLRITPDFVKLIERELGSRRARNGEIEQWKVRGCIGETNQGLVEPRPGQGCSGDVARLVGAENADRQSIQAKFMQHYNVTPGDAPRVRAAFAKENRDRARPGEWVQQPDGNWTKK